MRGKPSFNLNLSLITFGFVVVMLTFQVTTPVQAGPFRQDIDNENCIKCHEDLYFLHDTGNYFCIRESPMRCVDCHGGNPAATMQESAHDDRLAHPVLNEDISKCQECHTDADECCECLSKFDQVAGFKDVKLVSPMPGSSLSDQPIGLPAFEEQGSPNEFLIVEALPLFVIAGLVLTIYILHKVRHS